MQCEERVWMMASQRFEQCPRQAVTLVTLAASGNILVCEAHERSVLSAEALAGRSAMSSRIPTLF